jgi:CDP-diglyceride synthetase
VPPNKLRTAAQLRAFLTQSLHGLFSPERYQGSPLVLPTAGRILLVVLAAVLGALVVAGVVLAARSWTQWEISRRAAVAAYALAAAGAAVFSIGNAVVVVFQPQGRYLLVAATGPLLAAVWAIGRLARDRVVMVAACSACAAAALTLSVMGLTIARSATG